jgi:exopolysaccharide biosynthesis polyprenyl glycosylphosphotransferase
MVALLGICLWRGLYAQLFVQPRFEQRALVIGAGERGQALVEMLKATSNDANPFRGTGYRIVGFVDDRVTKSGTEIEQIPVMRGVRNLASMVQSLDVDELILASGERDVLNREGFDSLLRCRELGLRIVTLPALYERLLARIPVDYVGSEDLPTVIPMREGAGDRLYRFAKRGIDIISALVGLLVVGLLTPVIALANLITSPGPLFYRQERVGQGGVIFNIIKFRTMVPNAEEITGAVWANERDDRITWMGRILRPTRLDELPQFINILKGEMSLIGPRPERPEIIEDLTQLLPFYRARHAVRPGITGWAQVEYRYGNCVEDAKTKLEYDLYYVKHTGPLLDLRIILQTIPIMLRGAGI